MLMGSLLHLNFLLIAAVDYMSHIRAGLEERPERCNLKHLTLVRLDFHARAHSLEPVGVDHVVPLVVVHGVEAGRGEANNGPASLELTILVQE